MAQIIQKLSEELLPHDTGISVVFHDDEIEITAAEESIPPKNANIVSLPNADEAAPAIRHHPLSLRKMIFNPLHPSSELPPENLIELRKVHAGLAQRRKKKVRAETPPTVPLTLDEPFDAQENTSWRNAVLSILFLTCIVITFILQTNTAPSEVSTQTVTASEIPVFEQIEDTGAPGKHFNEPESGIFSPDDASGYGEFIITDG